jgi:tripeptide aminopeptidase
MMPKEIIKDLYPLLKVQSTSRNEHEMVGYIIKRLFSMGLNGVFDSSGNILVTKGSADNYPCIVAHMDTVHTIHSDYNVKIVQKGDRESAIAYSGGKLVGVGGDDKCGVYAVMYMLARVKNIKAVFFTQEESGLVGSNNIDHAFFSNVGYIIQLDRWGRGDFIDMYCGEPTVSTEYKEKAEGVMKRYGYKSVEGLITDSINLWSADVGVSCVNVSCGYYQHHSDQEFIDLNEFYNSLLFTYDLINELGSERYESVGEVTGYRYHNRWGDWTPSSDAYADYGLAEYRLPPKTSVVDEDLLFDVIDYLGIDIFRTDYGYAELMAIYDEYNARLKAYEHVTYADLGDYIYALVSDWIEEPQDLR